MLWSECSFTRAQKKAALFRAAYWRSPPGRREKSLHRRRSRTRRRRRLLLTYNGVGHQANVHAAVRGAAITSLVVLDRLVLAQSDQINLVGGNVVFRTELLDHRIRTALAQAIVVICWPDRIRSTLDRNDVALGVGHGSREFVEILFGLLGQKVFVEAKVDGSLAHDAIVIEVRDRVGKHVNPVHGVVSRLLGLRG